MSQLKNDENIDANQSTSREFKEENEISLTDDTLGLIGTSLKGPAFVPHTFKEFEKSDDILNTYENVFGSPLDMDHPDLSPLSAQEWFNQGGDQLAFTRVLGIGKTGIPNSEGIVEGSGFIVGGNVVSGSINEGYSGYNKFATAGGSNGKTHLIGGHYKNKQYVGQTNEQGSTFYKISSFNDYLQQIGYSQDKEYASLITSIVFCPKGNKLLFEKQNSQSLPITQNQLRNNLPSQSFDENKLSTNTAVESPHLFIKGLIDKSKNVLKDYKENISEIKKTKYNEDYINKNIKYFLNKGNFIYASFNPCNLDNITHLQHQQNTHVFKNFIIEGDSTDVSYEDFQSPYKSASTPWIVSQPVNRENIADNRVDMHTKCIKLFRFHAIDDGEIGNRYRIRITPKKLGNKSYEDYSIFDVIVWEYNLKENKFTELFSYSSLNLNPKSKDYIGLVFGTERVYCDFKTNKILNEGAYRQTNNHLRVEINDKIEYENLDSYELIPSGFMPYPRINTSNINISDMNNEEIKQKPLDYCWNILYKNISEMSESKYWGVLFDDVSFVDINKTIGGNQCKFRLIKTLDKGIDYYKNYYWYSKYFQDNYLEKTKNVWIRDLEDSNTDSANSFFHLEKIMYIPANANDPVQKNWEIAMYRRDGKKISDITSLGILKNEYEYIKIDDLLKTDDENNSVHSEYLSFDFFTCGGFDGVNILDNDKRLINQTALIKELEDENQNGQIEGPTYFSYKKAHDIMVEDANSEFDILSMPSIGHHYLNKKISIEANEKSRYLVVLNSPEYSNHVDNANNIPTNTGIIKDYNHFYIEPGEPDNNSKFKTKQHIGKYIDSGTMDSLNAITENYYNSRYTLNVLNTSKGFLDNDLYEDKRFVAMPAFIAIKSFARGIAVGPIDNVNTFFPSSIEIKRVINNSLNSPGNNDFSKLIRSSLKPETNANFVAPKNIFDNFNIIKLNSANVSLFNRNNLLRRSHNVRIIISIKKNIKYTLFQNDILFNNNSRIVNINSSLNARLNEILQPYVDFGIIKDFFVKLNTGASNKEKEDALDYILRSKIGISLFGKLDNNVVAFSLDDIINSTQNNLTEIKSIDIMTPSI